MAAYQYIYMMKNLAKIYPGGREILKNITLAFLPGAKIGVLGINGAGKSTLLKIMAGIDNDIDGEAWAAQGVKVGYLPQEPQLDPAKDVLGNVMEGVGPAKALLDRFDEVSNQFADPDADMDTLLAEQAELQEKIDACNAWELERTIEIAMDALRCPPGDADVADALRRRAPPRGAVPAAARQPRHAAAGRADQPSRRRIGGLAGAVPGRVQGHGRGRHPRPLLPRQRRRLDPRARPRPRHSLRGQLLRLAGAEAQAPGAGGAGARAASGPWSASWSGSARARRPARPRARRASRPTRTCSPRRARGRPRPARS